MSHEDDQGKSKPMTVEEATRIAAHRALGESDHRSIGASTAIFGAKAFKQVGDYDDAIAMYELFIREYGNEENLTKLETGDKKAQAEAVERVKAAFEAIKGHKDYTTTTDDGTRIPIFTPDVHLKLSTPANYAALIRLLQDLPPLRAAIEDLLVRSRG